ncbi:MAG: hypothetical protein H9533_21810 [Rhodobacteraceae bacterium]|nr:hypothetical protein [Paracoccaceae bacterium]
MDIAKQTGLARWLAEPHSAGSLVDLAAGWRDHDIILTLAPVAPAGTEFGAHLRRSFLGGLAPGASVPARIGQPCPWDPPCALDVFLREQLRAGGDGLPKPYVLFWHQQARVMEVTLRIFGIACDWAPAAAEGITAGLTSILPWSMALRGQPAPPAILHRFAEVTPLADDIPEGPLTLTFLSPMDDEGANPKGRGDAAARLLSRALRRVDALARWQGLRLSDTALRDLTARVHALRADSLRLQRATCDSPNRHSQVRRTQVVSGSLDLPPLDADLRLLLSLIRRCHLGRHTNEGLGRIEIKPRR